MIWIIPSAALTVLALICAAPADAGAIGENDYARVNAALVEGHALPRYARLADGTEAFAAAVDDFCTGAGHAGGRAAVEARFHDAMDAWMGVRHLRFGPVERHMRAHRFHFWPQARSKVREALRTLIAEGGEGALNPARFAQANVAVQGFLAAEILLHDGERLGVPLAAGPAGCRVLRAVAANMRGMAVGIVAEWRDGKASFADVVARPGPRNEHFEDHRDATLAFFRSLHDGLQFVADIRLRPVVGDDIGKARPHLAESRLSGRSLRNVIGNLEALQVLYRGEDGSGLGELAAADAKVDRLMRRAFRLTLETARSVDGPLEDVVTDPAARPRAEKLTIQVRALSQIVRERLAPALGFPIGFNSLDGD